MHQINRNPSRRDLTIFGLLLPVFVAVIGLLAYSRGSPLVARMIWMVGGGLSLVYLVIPPLRRWVFVGWMFAAFPIGWTISHLVLALVYYLVLTPIGLVLRLLGRDPLEKHIEGDRESYWEEYQPSGDSKRYFRQF